MTAVSEEASRLACSRLCALYSKAWYKSGHVSRNFNGLIALEMWMTLPPGRTAFRMALLAPYSLPSSSSRKVRSSIVSVAGSLASAAGKSEFSAFRASGWFEDRRGRDTTSSKVQSSRMCLENKGSVCDRSLTRLD